MNGGSAVSRASPVPPQPLPTSLRRFGAGQKRTTRPRGISAGSPVRGFRAKPVLREAARNTPNRQITTRSPRGSDGFEQRIHGSPRGGRRPSHRLLRPFDEVGLHHAGRILCDTRRAAHAPPGNPCRDTTGDRSFQRPAADLARKEWAREQPDGVLPGDPARRLVRGRKNLQQPGNGSALDDMTGKPLAAFA